MPFTTEATEEHRGAQRLAAHGVPSTTEGTEEHRDLDLPIAPPEPSVLLARVRLGVLLHW